MLLIAAYLYAAATTNRVAALPITAPRLDNGVTVVNLATAPRQTRERCGYYDLDETKPAAVGAYYTRAGYERVDAHTFRTLWTAHPITPPVVRYSKLKLITAAKSLGKWQALKAWIAAAGYEDEWIVCQYLSSDYEGFDRIVDAVVAAGVATRAEVTQILAASVDDGR